MQVEVEALPEGVTEGALLGEVQRRLVAAFHDLRHRLTDADIDMVSEKYLMKANGRRIPLCAATPVNTSTQ